MASQLEGLSLNSSGNENDAMEFAESLDSSQTEDVMTAAELLAKLEKAWIAEKMSPNLEPHQAELVDCMLDQLSQMTDNVAKCKKNDIRIAVHKMEIDRIRYVISSYMRIRLQKVEKYPKYLLDLQSSLPPSKPQIMSPREIVYAKSYLENYETHVTSLAIQHMPENLRASNPSTIVKPNLDAYVFFKVLKDVPSLLIEDNTGEGKDEEVDLETGEQHLMRYSTIQELLQEEAIQLL